MPGLGWSSSNWSGYAVTAGPYTSATGTWTVPAVNASARATYSSSWVGIDGFNSSTLIQAGTDQDYYLGSAHYSAWWEIVPSAGGVFTSMAIHPGDEMSATIAKNATGGTWTITLVDLTTDETFTTTQGYNGSGSSAEWIQEAPTVGTKVATLANYGTTTFSGTVNGGDPGLAPADRGTMVQNAIRVSTPSAPDSRTGGFRVQSTSLPGAAILVARGVSSPRPGVKLTWSAASPNGSPVTGYRIYRATNTGGDILIATVRNGHTYTDLSAGTSRAWSYKVAAVSDVGSGPRSNVSRAVAR